LSLNPLENDFDVEANLAKQQYAALMAYAKSPIGLSAKIERDRRAELTPLEHGSRAQVAFRLLNVLSLGTYVHREELSGDIEERLDVPRRLNYHTKFLEKVARSKADIEMDWNIDEVKRSLIFLAEHGSQANSRAID